MPTRLDVLLQRRKSAAAELFHSPASANATTGARPAMMRAERGVDGRESFAVMRRGYIKLLTNSRGPAGPANARCCVSHDVGYGIEPPSRPDLRVDMAKSVTIP